MPNKVFNELNLLSTESVNKNTENIDRVSTRKLVELINNEDKLCAEIVGKASDKIANAIDLIASVFEKNGRLFYIGAGTSGRLGVLDASECPPTFGTDPDMVQGIIAGGNEALIKAQEGSEDVKAQAWLDLKAKNISSNDVLCGIMASGRTPYVVAAIEEAKKAGIPSIIVACNKESNLITKADINICVDAGPEVIMGSTRMKSGTMQKMILNMLTTGSMIKIGKTYKNIMVDLQMNSQKLVERSKKIVMLVCDLNYEDAEKLLERSVGNTKQAIVMHFLSATKEDAEQAIKAHKGKIYSIIEGENA